jgi:hypothetical protein
MWLSRQIEPALIRRWTAVLVVLLVAGFGFVQSIHLHDDSVQTGAAHSRCALCAFSHSPAVITATGATPSPATNVAAQQCTEPELRSLLLVSSAFIRPPPIA